MIRRTHTPDDTLDPVVAAELAELERALAGAPNADPVLSALVRDVRGEAPDFDGQGRAALDAKVADGFGRRTGPRRLLQLLPGRPLLPVLGVVATVALGLIVATTALNGDSPDATTGLPSGGLQSTGSGAGADSAARGATSADAQTQESAAAPSSTPQDPSTSASPPTASDPGRLDGPRRVERSAQMTLSTAPDEAQSVSDAVIRTVQGLGGVVASSQIATGDAGGQASFDLRLPTARLDRAIAELSKLAHVSALVQDSDDITGAFVSAGARLQDARDERQALLKALGRATTDRQVSSLRARIADSRRRIATLEGELRVLRSRTDRATIGLVVRGDGTASGPGHDDGGAWTPGDAARDALRVLEVIAGVLVVAGAVLIPAGLFGLLALLTVRAMRRRSRLRALDAT